jgi:hypothetical protein
MEQTTSGEECRDQLRDQAAAGVRKLLEQMNLAQGDLAGWQGDAGAESLQRGGALVGNVIAAAQGVLDCLQRGEGA